VHLTDDNTNNFKTNFMMITKHINICRRAGIILNGNRFEVPTLHQIIYFIIDFNLNKLLFHALFSGMKLTKLK